MTFQTEFPDYPAADMPALPVGFYDSSWKNDACPSYLSETLRLSIYIDYADVAQRDLGEDSDRFTVHELDAEACLTGEQPLLATNDWSDVLAFIATKREG